MDGGSRLWMGLGVKDENETPAAAGEVTKEKAVKNDDDSGDMGESIQKMMSKFKWVAQMGTY